MVLPIKIFDFEDRREKEGKKSKQAFVTVRDVKTLRLTVQYPETKGSFRNHTIKVSMKSSQK